MIESDRVTSVGAQPELVHTPSESGQGQKIARCPKCHVALWSHYAGAETERSVGAPVSGPLRVGGEAPLAINVSFLVRLRIHTPGHLRSSRKQAVKRSVESVLARGLTLTQRQTQEYRFPTVTL